MISSDSDGSNQIDLHRDKKVPSPSINIPILEDTTKVQFIELEDVTKENISIFELDNLDIEADKSFVSNSKNSMHVSNIISSEMKLISKVGSSGHTQIPTTIELYRTESNEVCLGKRNPPNVLEQNSQSRDDNTSLFKSRGYSYQATNNQEIEEIVDLIDEKSSRTKACRNRSLSKHKVRDTPYLTRQNTKVKEIVNANSITPSELESDNFEDSIVHDTTIKAGEKYQACIPPPNHNKINESKSRKGACIEVVEFFTKTYARENDKIIVLKHDPFYNILRRETPHGKSYTIQVEKNYRMLELTDPELYYTRLLVICGYINQYMTEQEIEATDARLLVKYFEDFCHRDVALFIESTMSLDTEFETFIKSIHNK